MHKVRLNFGEFLLKFNTLLFSDKRQVRMKVAGEWGIDLTPTR